MFEEITQESTLQKLRALLPPTINTMEGSWYDAELRAVALMHVEGVRALSAMLPIAFPDETAGRYIDQRAKDYGLYRSAGTRATVTVTFACIDSDGLTIPAGTGVATATGLAYLTDAPVTISGAAATVTATAAAVGAAYNQPENAIIRLREAIVATVTAISSSAATGGSDAETDASFYARLKARLAQVATGENVYSYHDWAMSVPGVFKCKIWPRKDGRGTVSVYPITSDRAPAGTALCNAVAAKIDQERPIGSDVTVSAPTPVSIAVTGSVALSDSQTLQELTARVTAAVSDYLAQLIDRDYDEILSDPARVAQPYVIITALIASMIIESGALDAADVKINGSTANFSIDADEVPVLGGVTLATLD